MRFSVRSSGYHAAVRLLPLLVLAVAASAQAQPALVDAPLRETFDDFTGAGFAPDPAAGQLDSDDWVVTGLSAGDLAFGDSGVSGSYARGSAAGAVAEAGVWAFEVASGDPALGAQPAMNELAPGAFVTRFTNGTGAELASFTIAYECWQYNDQARATDLSVEITTGAGTESPAELDCTGAVAADGSPAWASTSLATVYTPSTPIAAGDTVELRFVLVHRGGGAAYDQVAIDELILGLVDQCGNGIDEGGDSCDDGDPCTTDACVEPTGCVFDPIAMCDLDGGVASDGGVDGDGGAPTDGGSVEPSDADVPPRYDANMLPNDPVPDLGVSDGPEPDGCDCRTGGGSGAALWPLLLVLAGLRRRRR